MTPRPANPRRTCPFTLLELVSAISLTAVLLVAVLGTLRGAMALRETENANLEDDAHRQHVLERIAADLRAVVPPGSTLAGTFLGEMDEEDDFRRDTLTFATAVNSPRDGTFGADIVVVTYTVEEVDGEDGPLELVRGVYANPLAPEEEDPDETVLLTGAQALAFSFFDGEEWLDTWDSSLQDNGLPQAILARVELGDGTDPDVGIALEVLAPVLAQPREEEEGQGGGQPGGAMGGR